MTMSTTTIVSQDWDEVVARTSETTKTSLGTTSADVVLLEPQRGFAAFSTTFRYMFKEEWRENIDFARGREAPASLAKRAQRAKRATPAGFVAPDARK